MPDSTGQSSKTASNPVASQRKDRHTQGQPLRNHTCSSFIVENFRCVGRRSSVGFANKPVSVFVATLNTSWLDSAPMNALRRAFFGPTGVLESVRGEGVGTALALSSWGLRERATYTGSSEVRVRSAFMRKRLAQ
jgi:hypothetical protein